MPTSNPEPSPHAHLSLRPARIPEDEARIAEIVGEIWQGSGDAILENQYGQIGKHSWQYNMAQAVIGWIKAPNAEAYVVEDTTQGNRIIAFTSLLIDHDRDTGTVGYNAVSASHQGLRIGNFMMDFVMRRFAEEKLGYAGVLVADNPEHAAARHVYEKHGFKSVYALHYLFQKLS